MKEVIVYLCAFMGNNRQNCGTFLENYWQSQNGLVRRQADSRYAFAFSSRWCWDGQGNGSFANNCMKPLTELRLHDIKSI